MARRDARSLDHATLEEMRRLAVKRALAGEGRPAVAESLQVHAGAVAKKDRALVLGFFGHPQVAYVREALRW